MASIIDLATIQPYRETHYRITGERPLTLVIGEPNPALAELQRTSDVQSSAFVTACNPYSHVYSDADNLARQQELACELERLGHRAYAGIGEHPSGNWPGEPSFLVLGISLEDARALGARHHQNAIVWSDTDAVPQLILIR